MIRPQVDAPGRAAGSPIGASEELTIHPAGHFWAFQTIETAIFVALAVGLVLAAIYWIRHRIA